MTNGEDKINDVPSEIETHTENKGGEFTEVMTQLLEHMDKVHSCPMVDNANQMDLAASDLQYQEHCTLQQLSAMIENTLGPLPPNCDLNSFPNAEMPGICTDYSHLPQNSFGTTPVQVPNLSEFNINSIQFGNLADSLSQQVGGGSYPVIILNVQQNTVPVQNQFCGTQDLMFPFILRQESCDTLLQEGLSRVDQYESNVNNPQGKLRRNNNKRRRSIEQSDYDRDVKRNKFDNNDTSFNQSSLPWNHQEEAEEEEIFSKLLNICDDNLTTPSVLLTPGSSCFSFTNQQQQLLDEFAAQPSTPIADLPLLEYLFAMNASQPITVQCGNGTEE